MATSDDLADLERRDAILRRRRDASLRKVYRELGDLRNLLKGWLGREPSRVFLGLRSDSSRDPVVLLRQADRAVARLRDRAKKPRGVGLCEAERQRWAAPLAEKAETLRRRDHRVRTSAKTLDAARMDRRRALADFNQIFTGVAEWFERTYRLINRDDLADVVQPSKQYPGRTAAEMKERLHAGADVAGRLLSFDPLRGVARILGLHGVAAGNRR